MAMKRKAWLRASAAIAISFALPAPSLAADALAKAFTAPPAQAKPFARWWWPGGAVSDAELQRQISLMAKTGFGGAEIQAFNPGVPSLTADERARINDYANPAFFSHVRAVTAAAARDGMKIDYTFGSAWPSGGGFAVTPELALVELTQAITEVDGAAPGPIKVAIPKRTRKLGAMGALDPRSKDPRAADWRDRLDARQRVVAVVAAPGQGPELAPEAKGGFKLYPWRDVVRSGALDLSKAVILTDRLAADGTLDWSPPPGRWQVFVFKQYAVDSGVMAGVGEGPQLVLDHFRKEAFDAHAARVGAPLTAGPHGADKSLNATFVDSLELMQDLPWTDALLAEFKARRGYDLTPYLPLILQPGWMQAWGAHYSPPYYGDDALGARVRADYRRTLSDLQLENFWRPFVDWNHAHGLKARVQAHGGTVDILKAYGLADIPETEDLEGSGNPVFMRLARSAANLYGRQLVSAESFVWPGEPYDVTPARIRQRADLLFASGVNRVVYHGYPYVMRPGQALGWHPFAPSPFGSGFSTPFNELNPVFAAAPQLNAYIARTQAVLQQGRSEVAVALFLGETGYYPEIEPLSRHHDGLEPRLLAAGYDNDRINADALSRSRVLAGALVTPGGARYRALVLPPLEGLDVASAEKIATFAAQGLKIVFVDTLPRRADSLSNVAVNDRRVAAAVAGARANGAILAAEADLTSALASAGVAPNLTFEGSGALFVERISGARRVLFLHNTEAVPRKATFTTAAKGRAELWDAWSGTRTPLASQPTARGSRLSLDLAAGGSALIVFDPAKPAAKPTAETAERVVLEAPAGGWSLAASGFGPKGAKVVWSQAGVGLGDWSAIEPLTRFSGQATYSRSLRLEAKPKGALWLDLGEVHDVAKVTINGQAFAPVVGPFRLDVTKALWTGDNQLEITVFNTPNNAMVDPSVPAMKLVKPRPAGLVGPVRLVER